MDEDRIDFSVLDPLRDPARFERAVSTVLAGVSNGAASHPILDAIYLFGRRAVLAAGVVAAAAWVLVFITARSGSGTGGASLARDPVALISTWAEAGCIPDGVDVLQAMEVIDGR